MKELQLGEKVVEEQEEKKKEENDRGTNRR